MATLNSSQRSSLESAVINARKKAEKGAVNALKALAVDQVEPFSHMTPDQRQLRNRLRVKARLLGDILQPDYKQDIDHLSYELAYEYWHKMLFAKFLESNSLLIHPSHGISNSLEECEEMAAEEGYPDKWTAAAFYASKMLPAIFRPEDPLMQLEFSTEDRIALENILAGIEDNIFLADDSLGWVYQFWQSEAKAAINASGDPIDGARLPAVTQLFTEPYMVHFLIDNTLGAWWVSRNQGINPPVRFEYLRLLEDGKPAAGSFESWPDKSAQITTLDPCMGSGHFVVSLFLVMVKLRMFDENLTAEEATDIVIKENLHGLEIDPRCTQLAAFNLALTAWKFIGHYKELPEMNLACSGIAPKGKVEDWIKLVGNVPRDDKARMENGMKMLFDHFQLAPELGSLIDPSTIKPDAFTASFLELKPLLLLALEGEADKDQVERGVMAAGIAKAGQILSNKYVLQITNVPYLTIKKQAEVLALYSAVNYPSAKGDLATVFLERMLKGNKSGGTSSVVIPQNWLFLTTYRLFRELIIKNKRINIICRLGEKGFQTPMWDFNVMLISVSNETPDSLHSFTGLDVSKQKSAQSKSDEIPKTIISVVNQLKQLRNPDSRVIIGDYESMKLLKEVAKDSSGCLTSDGDRFFRYYFEVQLNDDWEYLQSTTKASSYFGGCQQVIYWQQARGDLYYLAESLKHKNHAVQNWRRGQDFWNKAGVAVNNMGKLSVSLYQKGKFDNNISVLIPHQLIDICALWCFCSSPQFHDEVRKIDQKLNVTNATLVKVPFDLEYWQKVAKEKCPNGLPKPYSDDPTQWLFHGHPVKSDNPLQVAVARLLGFQWPAETDAKIELSDKARNLIKEAESLNAFADNDGIVCIPSVNGEPAAADRLRELLKSAYASEWNNFTIEELLKQTGSNTTSLETWLREYFFEQHFKLFHHRPFIWHIWDGRKDGFSVLVNYHKLTKETLEKIIFRYLGDWIHQCEARKNESGAEGLLMAAKELKKKLEAILEGEAPFDIFVRWKPMHQQPIGLNPDLNDGVRMNIRPFVEAGVLRKRPNIKWDKDRGKNPPNSPWGEDRINDTHLSLAQKREALENWKLSQQNLAKPAQSPNPLLPPTIE
jgi:hypothetical protein